MVGLWEKNDTWSAGTAAGAGLALAERVLRGRRRRSYSLIIATSDDDAAA
jgi:hypothetical protein